MERIVFDQTYIEIAIEQLPQYLQSQNLYWPLSQSQIPLTIGNLLFSMRRLSVLKINEARFENIPQKLNSIRLGNRASFERKEESELRARIREWTVNLDELKEKDATIHIISTEVRNRVIIELLVKDLQKTTAIDQRNLDTADLIFRKYTQPGKFIWDEALQQAFQEKDFWFLYTEPARR